MKRAETVMHATLGRLQALFGKTVKAPTVQIMQDIRDLQYDPELATFGYYNRRDETLYVACSDGSTDWLEVAVRHEVAHHYLNLAFGELPTWLAEGLATYSEVGPFEDANLWNSINKPRFNNFIDMLKWNRALSITDLFSGPPLSKRASQYYAGYWALVFALMHNSDLSVQNRRRQLLISLLNEPHKDLQEINQRLIDGLLIETPDLAQWELRWRRELWNLR